jgi:hypothetical protein
MYFPRILEILLYNSTIDGYQFIDSLYIPIF